VAFEDEDSAGAGPGEEKDRRSLFRKRAQLIVTGAQDQERPITYLVDSLREAMGLPRIWGTQANLDDDSRIKRVQHALALATRI